MNFELNIYTQLNFPFTVVAIFFAVKLSKAELPEWLDYILVAFVAFHVLMHLIFSVSNHGFSLNFLQITRKTM